MFANMRQADIPLQAYQIDLMPDITNKTFTDIYFQQATDITLPLAQNVLHTEISL